MIAVFVVAPTLASRAGLRVLLSGAGEPGAARGAGGPEGVEVLGEAAGLPGVERFPAQVDVLVLAGGDWGLPPGGAGGSSTGGEAGRLAALAAAAPGRLAMLLLDDDPQAAVGLAGLPWRAWGRLPADPSAAELTAAVHALAEGLLVGPPELLRAALAPQAPALRLLSGAETPPDALTERESEVLQHLARGLANKQIALVLGISEHTVKFHVASIYAKLGVSNRTEAVRWGIQQGLIVI